MVAQNIISSEEFFGTEEEKKKKKKKIQPKLDIITSEEFFGKPKVTPKIIPPKIQPKPSQELIQQKLVPPSQYKRESVFEVPTMGQKVSNVLYEAGRGFVEEALLNIPKFPRPGQATEWQPAAEGIGRFLGFIVGAPIKLGKLGWSLVFKGLKKPATKTALKILGKETPTLGKITQHITGSAFQLGLASAISEVEDIKGMPERFKSGAIFGTIFGIAGLVNLKKMPFLSQIIRQVGTRATARTANMYQMPYENLEQWTTPEAAQRWFDELLFGWFSRKPINPAALFGDLRKLETEMKTLKAEMTTGETAYKDKLREMLKTSGRKPEEIETWVEAEWKKKEPILPKVWELYRQPKETIETIGGRYIITGSGEIIPMDLFSQKINLSDLKKVIPELEVPPTPKPTPKPVVKPTPKAMPHVKEPVSAEALARAKKISYQLYDVRTKKTTPLIGVEAVDIHPKPHEIKIAVNKITGKSTFDYGAQVSEPQKKWFAQQQRKELAVAKGIIKEKPLPKGKELEVEIQKFIKRGGEVEKAKPGRVAPPKLTEDLKTYYSGLHFPRLLNAFDKYLEKKLVIEPVQEEFQRQESRHIAPIIKEVIAKDQAEKIPIIGLKVRNQLRRFGKPGNQISDMTDRFTKNYSQHIQEDIFKLKTAVTHLGKDITWWGRKKSFEKTAQEITGKIYDLLEGKRKPATQNEKEAYNILKPIIDNYAQRAKDLDIKISTMFGEKPWQELKNYAPVEYDPKGFRQFLEAKEFKHLRDWYVEMIAKTSPQFAEMYKTDKAKALRNAEMYFEEFRNDLKTKPFGHLERQRLLDEAALEKLRIRWKRMYPDRPFPLQRKKTFDVLVRYVVGANQRLDWIQEFGKDMEWGKGWYIPEKLHQVASGFEKARSKEWTFNFFKKYLRQTAAIDTRVTKLIRGIRTFQLTKLAFAWIPNSLQWFTNTLPQIPLKAIPKTFWDAAKYYGLAGKKNKALAREWFSRTGASTLRQAVQLAMMENPSKTNAAADLLLKLHLFTGTEFNNALLSASSGKWKAMILSERLHKKGAKSWRAPFYRAELKKLGLSEARIEQIIRDGPLTEANVIELADAAFYMRRATQFLANAFELPKTWSTPAGRLFTQFKNFAYNQSAMLWEEGAKEAFRFVKTKGHQGDITKMMKWAVALPVAGALVTKFKEWGFKKVGIHFYEELMAGKSWPFKLMVYVLNTGNLGLSMDVLMAFQYGKAGITSLIGGPTVSDILGFFQAMGDTWKELGVAWDTKNPEWLKHRAKTIRDYWLRFGERLSPDARIPIHNFFKEYRQLKNMTNWNKIYRQVREKYRHLYKLKSPQAAYDLWNAFMETQGQEYIELFGRRPQKPTPKEIEKWWKEQELAKSGRMKMGGKKPASSFEFWY